MAINNESEVALSSYYTTQKEKEMMFHFPALLCFDVTKNSNLEKRSLFLTSGFDGNSKIYIDLNYIMPNGMLESFGWTFELTMINLELTDGVKHMKRGISYQEQFCMNLWTMPVKLIHHTADCIYLCAPSILLTSPRKIN